MQHTQRRKKKKRRFRPLRRLLLVAILFLLIYGLFSASRWAYRALFTPKVKYITVQAVDQSFYKGKVVVSRDEFIIAAPKSGIINKLVEHSTSIQAGQPILEIVDQSLLSSIDKQLADEANKIIGKSAQTDDAIQFKKQQLAALLSKVRALTSQYAELVSKMNIAQARVVFKEIESEKKALDKLQQEYDLVALSQEQYETRRQELLNQRQQAIHPVVTPLKGAVSYVIDGFESKLKPADINNLTLDYLRQITSSQKTTANGDKVNAGQPIAKIVDEGITYLILETKKADQFTGELQVVLGDEIIPCTVLTKLPTSESGVYIVALKVNRLPRVMFDQRIIEVTIRSVGETLTSVPKSAVWESGGKTWVYVKTADGHIPKIVSTVQTSSKAFIVSGLSLGENVVSNPKLLHDKESR